MSAGDGPRLDVAVLGAGPVGLVYATQLARDGHRVVFLRRPGSTPPPLEGRTLAVTDWGTGRSFALAPEFADAAGVRADLAIVAVGAHRLAEAAAQLLLLWGAPTIVTLGQNPRGLGAFPQPLRDQVQLGYPGISGAIRDGEVTYVRLAQQPTMLAPRPAPTERALVRCLDAKSFPVRGEAQMAGWLAHQAVWTALLARSVLDAGGDPAALAADRARLRSFWRALREGWTALEAEGVAGRPRGGAALVNPVLGPLLRRRIAREAANGETGDRVVGVYARGLGDELPWLVEWVLALADASSGPTGALRCLLAP